MNKLIVLALAAGFCVAPLSLLAEDKKEDGEGKKKKKEIPAEVIEKYDEDGDGKLNKEEKQKWRKDKKAAKEADGDSAE